MRRRLFICNRTNRRIAASASYKAAEIVELFTRGPKQNVNLKLQNISNSFLKLISPRLVDLLEIAAFVYAGDGIIARDGAWTEEGSIEPWSRDLSFQISVRDIEFWRQTDVQSSLAKILNFLSDDKFSFEFDSLSESEPTQGYLELADTTWPFSRVDHVLMFSGGLDSLAGAVQRASDGKPLLLVSHRSISTISARQTNLVAALRNVFPKVLMHHVPVWVNNEDGRSAEYTQRTRSFLFWALGCAVAHLVKANVIQFGENGVVSMNLPIADQVVRARASRTTHPVSLKMLSELSQMVLDRPCAIENPFIFSTKADVIEKVVNAGAENLIQHSCSCSRTHFQARQQWHCGMCSQCIDRRLAIVASGNEKYDPDTDYETDVIIGGRSKRTDQLMAVSYVRHAVELSQMSAESFATQFNTELSRAIRPFDDPMLAAQMLTALHIRHGQTVVKAIEQALSKSGSRLISGQIDSTSLLALTAGLEHLQPIWRRFAVAIGDVLSATIPRACKSHKPKNENHLQEICDGLLKAAEQKLLREFPFQRWGSRFTKPDFSSVSGPLWIELKHARKSKDVHRITEEIAADITKYGDNEKQSLFVIYDPERGITDEDDFCHDIIKHRGMFVRIIR